MEQRNRHTYLSVLGFVLTVQFAIVGCGDQQSNFSADDEPSVISNWVSDAPEADLELIPVSPLYLDDYSWFEYTAGGVLAHLYFEDRDCFIEFSTELIGGIGGDYITIRDNRCDLEDTTFTNRYRFGVQIKETGFYFRLYNVGSDRTDPEPIRIDYLF